jgi:hypothetical protein
MLQMPRQGPTPDPERAALLLVRRLSREDFGADAAIVTDTGEIKIPDERPAGATP